MAGWCDCSPMDGEIIRDSMGRRAQRLFTIFALLVLILVIASFVNVVAGTFMSAEGFGVTGAPSGNQTTAMISLLFIVLAIIYVSGDNVLLNKQLVQASGGHLPSACYPTPHTRRLVSTF